MQGEKRFSTQGKTPTKFVSRLPVPGDYELKLLTSAAAVKKSNQGEFPYVSCMFEILGTPPPDNDDGANIKLFHMFFVTGRPQKDGKISYEREDQILGLARSLGEELECGMLELADKKGDTYDCLNPNDVLKWLQEHDGMVVKGHVKIQKGSGNFPDDKGIVNRFEEAEASAAPSGMGFGGMEQVVEEEAEIEEEMPLPPPKKAPAKAKGKK